MKKYFFLLTICLLIFSQKSNIKKYFKKFFIPFSIQRTLDYSWTKHQVIAHALGGYKGQQGTNSLEAFQESLQKGFKLFEVDLNFTKDGVLVAKHDWHNGKCRWDWLTLENFRKRMKSQNLTGLTFTEILILMDKIKDIFLIIDIKHSDSESIKKYFNCIVSTCHQVNPEILNRIIPEIYTEKMFEDVESIHPFKSYLYSTYLYPREEQASPDYPQKISNFCLKNSIKAVAAHFVFKKLKSTNGLKTKIYIRQDLIKELKEKNIKLFVHPVNEPDLPVFLTKGIHGLYTDFLGPDMKEIKTNFEK